ncbi:hypothetical protein HRG_007452 [Hirsutella rhossiliensis]|uniref:Uncharacterized protein n=1 Tax=Hirsutella rhossiliensis TaxID=111463 RepID=A0A9P8MUG4_9HYPO|nr:uncharacterized protein HRG_07452 [Hirsutella rhossiliensis]KAH0961374.1 hypothetical protein HRG_07452 [Hirsutella rhossiliensis]
MLDDNLPTFRLQPCPDDPLQTLVYYAHNGSEPAATYLLKRPSPPSSRNQFALGLLDAQLPSLVYAEVAVRPEWTHPTLSAAEVRASSSSASPSPAPVTPDSFAVSLYDPDMAVTVKHRPGSWNKSEAWEFEVPERSFRMPSASRIDQDSAGAQLAALAPKVVFRWKRDGRLSKDMTCYMSGRSVGGKKSKEPDITVAMFRAAKNEGLVTIYEPNMARVDIEDLKGLELSLILGSVVIRDLYLAPRQDAFNVAGASGLTQVNGQRKGSGSRPPPQATTSSQPVYASGALGIPPPASPPAGRDARQHAEIEAETKRLQAMVAQENRKAREREKRDAEEQKRIKKMLEDEDKERRRREAEVERETERLRREYGVPSAPGAGGPSPALPPRTGQSQLPARHSGGW